MRLFPSVVTLILPLALVAHAEDPANIRLKTLISYPSTMAYPANSVIVAVIDTGVSLPAYLKNHVLSGANVIRPNESAGDHQGHGTAVAGVILQIAPNARILPVMVADEGIGSTEGLIDGIVYAINQGAQVINLSIGVTDLVWEKVTGIVGPEKIKRPLFVVAAGNSGDRYITRKPVADNVIIVGATELDKPILASYSVWGNKVQMAAPAGSANDGIWTFQVVPENSHRLFNGTSGATPVVAGAAALLKSQQRELSAAELKSALLKSSCSIPKLRRWIEQGRLLNVGRLLKQSTDCPK